MRTRYSLDESGVLLVDRNGERLGRVISLTIDDAPPTATTARLGNGERCSHCGSTVDPSSGENTNVEPHTPRPTGTQLQREAVQRVWDYWTEITGKRQKFDSKRERIIRNALELVGEEAVKTALLGLTRSPHHRGENEQHRPYMEIRYALKGIGDESDDERIEKAISWAAQYAPSAKKVDPARVDRWLEDVRYTLSQPHRPERARGEDAWRKLKEAGFNVVALDKAPWARIRR